MGSSSPKSIARPSIPITTPPIRRAWATGKPSRNRRPCCATTTPRPCSSRTVAYGRPAEIAQTNQAKRTTATQKQIEIFDPPYLAGTRPTINACPSFLAYEDVFTVGVANAEQIGTVVLMRCGSSTHAFNPDQRAVVLTFEPKGGNALTATAPPNGAVAPPGSYMLFVVDKQGRPCHYARFVRVGGRLSMFTNRSHFSIHEVQALLSGSSPGSVPNAFYAVLDGFAPTTSPARPAGPFRRPSSSTSATTTARFPA